MRDFIKANKTLVIFAASFLLIGYVLGYGHLSISQSFTLAKKKSQQGKEVVKDLDTEESQLHKKSLVTTFPSPQSIKQTQTPRYALATDTPQFILFSFDGSRSVPMLTETLQFAQKMKSEGKPLHFTYFISGVYFLTPTSAEAYTAPRHSPGTSAIGFGYSNVDIDERVRKFNEALGEGHEIGSHAVGHYDGHEWSYEEWKHEFAVFNALLTNIVKNNAGGPAITTPLFGEATVRGFRAPSLKVNNNLYTVLRDLHFTYDASGAEYRSVWPEKDSGGVWRIPLSIVRLGATHAPVIAMDYSLWMHQSSVQELAVKGTPLWQNYFNEVKNGYVDFFNRTYSTTRAPIVIGHHFSKWNDGVYWEAMKSFAEEECGKPMVRCVTFSELVNYLNTTGAPKVLL